MVEEGEDVTLPLIYVQRPIPPLTEEELAEIEVGPPIAYSVTRRLIADLRAARAELATYKDLVWGNECGCVGSAFRRAGVPIEP